MRARDGGTSIRRRGAVGAVVALGVALLGACSAGGTDAEPTPDTAQAEVEPSDVAPDDVDEAPAAPEDSENGTDAVRAAVSKEVDYDGGRLRLDVTPVVRSGDLARVTVTVTALSNPQGDETWYYYGLFSSTTRTAEDFELLDLENQQRYLTARDSDGDCVCTTGINGHGLLEGDSVEIYAVFAAPPASVETVDLVMPGTAGTVADVPVE